MKEKLIIFSAPSGSGKTTIVHRLLKIFDCLEFSISATSRRPRGQERDGEDYYFFTPGQFAEMVQQDMFVEWEEVYAGSCYGTLRSEIRRIWDCGHAALFDVDVKGGERLKGIFGSKAMSVFIMPPSLEELESRLVGRGTDDRATIDRRLAKAAEELTHAENFDHIVVNDNLDEAVEQTAALVRSFLDQ